MNQRSQYQCLRSGKKTWLGEDRVRCWINSGSIGDLRLGSQRPKSRKLLPTSATASSLQKFLLPPKENTDNNDDLKALQDLFRFPGMYEERRAQTKIKELTVIVTSKLQERDALLGNNEKMPALILGSLEGPGFDLGV